MSETQALTSWTSRLKVNNKIGVLKHRAYGFHSFTALAAMVFLCCTDLQLQLPIDAEGGILKGTFRGSWDPDRLAQVPTSPALRSDSAVRSNRLAQLESALTAEKGKAAATPETGAAAAFDLREPEPGS